MTEDGSAQWQAVARSPFALLGSYRRNGELLSAPVWIAADGDALVVTSESGTGKVKRLRRDDRVVLQPCSRFGAVEPDSPRVLGRGSIAGAPADNPSAVAALRAKYGLQYRMILALERSVRFLQRRSGSRVILRIVPEPTAEPGAEPGSPR